MQIANNRWERYLTPADFSASKSKLLQKTIYKKVSQMGSIDELILRATKEIVVKFIEAGRVSPTGFHETFKSVYNTVEKTVKGLEETPEQDDEQAT